MIQCRSLLNNQGVVNKKIIRLFQYIYETLVYLYVQRSVSAVLLSAEREKKRKYTQATEARHATFSPFVLSVDGVLAREARFVLKRFADKLSKKWSKPYSEVMGWLQTCLSFAILCAINRCVCGSHVKWRSGFGMENGVGMAIVMHSIFPCFIY